MIFGRSHYECPACRRPLFDEDIKVVVHGRRHHADCATFRPGRPPARPLDQAYGRWRRGMN